LLWSLFLFFHNVYIKTVNVNKVEYQVDCLTLADVTRSCIKFIAILQKHSAHYKLKFNILFLLILILDLSLKTIYNIVTREITKTISCLLGVV